MCIPNSNCIPDFTTYKVNYGDYAGKNFVPIDGTVPPCRYAGRENSTCSSDIDCDMDGNYTCGYWSSS